MRNKKGFLPIVLGLGSLIVIAVILLMIFISTGLLLSWIKYNALLLIGGFMTILSVIYIIKNSGKKNSMKIFGILISVGFVLLFINFASHGFEMNINPSSTFTPVYCNQYSFTCCNEKQDSSSSGYTLSTSKNFVCPLTATKCEITNSNKGKVYVGKSCEYSYHVGVALIGSSWYCSDYKVLSTPTTIYPGDTAFYYASISQSSSSIDYKTYKAELIFTGRSGGNMGVPVSGANGCTFNPSNTYDSSGNLVKIDKTGTSYSASLGECILTWLPGDRTICANLEEQCSSNDDCTGHTYGNKECTGRTLQTYGCKDLGNVLPSGVTNQNGEYVFFNKEGGSSPSGTITQSRCEAISTTQVQCCGDTDCGSNAFCDKSTFTCKATAECSNNYDCGTSPQCDKSTKTIKTPVCNSGKCSYSTKPIECCSSSDCAVGYFCSENNKCLQSEQVKIDCPFECCVSLDKYFDRPCSNGEFCIDNKCSSSGCKNDADCPTNQVCNNGNCVDKNPTITCNWYESQSIVGTPHYKASIFGIGVGKPDYIIETPTCKPNSFIILLAILITIIIIVLIVISSNKKNRKRRK